MSSELKKIMSHIKSLEIKECISQIYISHQQIFVVLKKADSILEVLAILQNDKKCLFKQLMSICGVDYPQQNDRTEIIYNLLSMTHNARIAVKITAKDKQVIPTVYNIFPCAIWYEREVWDMYGVYFGKNPDLRRILTDYNFDGHPLRKDFPLTGFTQTKYSTEEGRVVYEPVKLTQEFRNFDFTSPWENAQYVLPGDEKAS